MRSAKKNLKILSALAMAAAGALAAKTAHGVTLTMYYGNDPAYSHSNNALLAGTELYSSGPASGTTNAAGGQEYFAHATPVPAGAALAPTELGATGDVSASVGGNGIQTITIPVGAYLSLAIDALLTGNVNADAGVNSGSGTRPSSHQVQPSFLGLSQLDIAIPSSDTTGNILSPITHDPSPDIGNPSAGYTGTVYFSTAVLNTSGAGGNGQLLGANGGSAGGAYNIVPSWRSVHLAGGVEPNNAPGGWNAAGGINATLDSGVNASGNVGINEDPSGGTASGVLSASNTPAGVQQIEDFAAGTAAANATPSYSNATDFIDSLIYQGLSEGLVTLSPTVNNAATAYWTRSGAGSLTTPTTYGTQGFNATADTITNVPMLVIDVTSLEPITIPSSHAIVALAATAGANSNYPTAVTGTFSPATSPTLTITGGNGSYSVAQVTAINGGAGLSEGNVPVTTWNPATDPEIFGIDVKVNGSQATGAQLAALLTAINNGDSAVPESLGVFASTTDPTNGALNELDGGGVYNLFLRLAGGGPSASDDLGIDLSNSNDPNLTGYTFTAIAVVPEPMSLGLLAIGGVGLMTRRNRRNS